MVATVPLKELEKQLGTARVVLAQAKKAKVDVAKLEQFVKQLEQRIEKRKKLLSKVTMAQVKEMYDTLHQELSNYVAQLDTAYLSQMEYCAEVGSCFAMACETFKASVEANQKYKADLATAASSVLSVVGVGFLGYVAEASKLGEAIFESKKALQSGVEDAVQAGFDKVTPEVVKVLQTPAASSGAKPPQVFQNDFTNAASRAYRKLKAGLLNVTGATTALGKRLLYGETKRTPQAEFEAFAVYETEAKQAAAQLASWSNRVAKLKVNASLADNFERSLWAQWLPSLESLYCFDTSSPLDVKVEPITEERAKVIRDKKPADTKIVSAYGNWISPQIKQRVAHLIIKPGYVKLKADALKWASEDEIKVLVTWAKGYKPDYTF